MTLHVPMEKQRLIPLNTLAFIKTLSNKHSKQCSAVR